MEDQKREWTGYFIPKELWEIKDLTLVEKMFIVEVSSYKSNGCFKSNKSLSERFDLSERTISRMVSTLVDKGYLDSDIIYKKGTKEIEKRVIKSNFGYGKIVSNKRVNKGIPIDTDVDTPLDDIVYTPPVKDGVDSNTLFSNTLIEESLNINTETSSVNNDKALIKDKKVPLTLRQLVIHFWVKEFRTGWTFEGVHGKKIDSIIRKLKKVTKDSGREVTDELILSTFKHMCLSLPEFYQDKDLHVIDSKFNEIVTQIKNRKNGSARTQSKAAAIRQQAEDYLNS